MVNVRTLCDAYDKHAAKTRGQMNKCVDKCFYWVKIDECCCYILVAAVVVVCQSECVCVRAFVCMCFIHCSARLTVINYWSFRHFRISSRLFSTSLSISVHLCRAHKIEK